MSSATRPVYDPDHDLPKEECGVMGISSSGQEAARQAFFGLYALQHRGQEAAGIAVADGRAVRLHKGQGLVNQVFNPDVLRPLTGGMAIGHPLGATGARITGKAAALLQREKVKYALATQCIGGGQGVATILEAL